jgi:branched-chain amino acid transport system permease protein
MTTAPLDKSSPIKRPLASRAALCHNALFWIAFCLVIAALAAAPLVLSEFWRRLLTEILIWGLLAMSSDLLIGYTGMVSFGHSAFFGLGMYGAAGALLTVKPPNLWLAILFGLAGAAGAALFVAYFSTRLIASNVSRWWPSCCPACSRDWPARSMPSRTNLPPPTSSTF